MSYPILEQVKIRLKQYQVDKESEELTFDQTEENPYLEQLISQAKEDVKRNRNYPNSYTEDMINKDMEKFNSIIVDLALYDYKKQGGEFQDSYSENGFSGSWINRDEILRKVTPFVQFIF